MFEFEKKEFSNGEIGYVLSGYKGKEKDIVIPSMHNNCKVLAIGNDAFSWNEDIEIVTIEEGIKIIGVDAFCNCVCLKEIHLPSTLKTISRDAFLGCEDLLNIVIPDGVKIIDEGAFNCCDSIQSITIPASVKYIGCPSFMNKNIKSISVSEDNKYYDSRNHSNAIIHTSTNALIAGCVNTIIPPTVTSIQYAAFEDSAIQSIVIPEGVKTIKTHAFRACHSLTSISIPSTVEVIGNEAFRSCFLIESVTIDPHNKNYCLGDDGLSIINRQDGKKVFDYDIIKMVKKLPLLSKLEQRVIRVRYGLFNNRPKSLMEVAKILSISQEEVKQIEECALSKMA